jgi:uncharacterized protein
VRLVVDVNVLLSSLMSGELAGIAGALADERFEVFTSNEQLAELLDVAERPRFRKYFTLTEARGLVADFTLIAECLDVPADAPQVCRDPKDDHLLALAKVAKADILITGDSDLLVLGTHGRTRILKPRAFLREVR